MKNSFSKKQDQNELKEEKERMKTSWGGGRPKGGRGRWNRT